MRWTKDSAPRLLSPNSRQAFAPALRMDKGAKGAKRAKRWRRAHRSVLVPFYFSCRGHDQSIASPPLRGFLQADGEGFARWLWSY